MSQQTPTQLLETLEAFYEQYVAITSTVNGKTVKGEGFLLHATIEADGYVWVETDQRQTWPVNPSTVLIRPSRWW
jgi:hypothetical protein